MCDAIAPTTDVSEDVDASEAVDASEDVSSLGDSEAITPTVNASDASAAVGDIYEQSESNDDSVLESQLNKIQDWLTSADGGLKHSKSAKQHVAQVQVVLKSTEQNTLAAL